MPKGVYKRKPNEDIEFLKSYIKKYWYILRTSEIAGNLGISPSRVSTYAKGMGLVMSKENKSKAHVNAYIKERWYFDNIEDAKGLDMEYAKAKEDENFKKPLFEHTYEFNFGKEITEKELRDKVLKEDIHKDAKLVTAEKL